MCSMQSHLKPTHPTSDLPKAATHRGQIFVRVALHCQAPRSNRDDIHSQRHAGKEQSQDFSSKKDGALKAAIMPSTNPTYNIASIPGDGIGPEVISAAITVLQKLASTLGTFAFRFDQLPWSSEQYKAHGRYIPDGGLEELRKYDAILFGSVGDPGSAFLNLHLSPSQC